MKWIDVEFGAKVTRTSGTSKGLVNTIIFIDSGSKTFHIISEKGKFKPGQIVDDYQLINPSKVARGNRVL